MREHALSISQRICWNEMQLSVEEAFQEASSALVNVFQTFDIISSETLIEFMKSRNRRARVNQVFAYAATRELLQDAAEVESKVQLPILCATHILANHDEVAHRRFDELSRRRHREATVSVHSSTTS